MANDQSVGKVYVEIEAKLDALRAQLEQAKAQAASAGQQIGTSLNEGIAASVSDAGASGKILGGITNQAKGIGTTVGGIANSIRSVMGPLGTILSAATRISFIGALIVGSIKGAYELLNASYDKAQQLRDVLGQIADKSYEGFSASVDKRIAAEIDGLDKIDKKRQQLELTQLQRRQSQERNAVFAEEFEARRKAVEAGMSEEEARVLFVGRLRKRQNEDDIRFAQERAALEKQQADAKAARAKSDRNEQLKDIADRQRVERELEQSRLDFAKRQEDENMRAQEEYMKFEQDRFDRAKRAAEEAGKAFADQVEKATSSLMSAVEAFNSVNQGVNGVGQGTQFIAQKLEGLTRIADSIRAQQVGAVSGTTFNEGGF